MPDTMNDVLRLNDASFESEVLHSDRPVLVDFFAPWCGPCRALGPTIDRLAGRFAGAIKVGKLDVDENPETAAAFDIRSIPTVLLFRDGAVVGRWQGVQPEPVYEKALRQARGTDAEAAPHTVSVGLGGYSPVSYLESGRAEPGSPQHAAEHEGVTYFLASDRQRRAFEADPARFLPAYGGYCAFGCSIGSRFVPDPTSFEVIEGRTHLFLKNAEVDARKLWNEADLAELKARADDFWSAPAGSPAPAGQ